MGIQSKRGISKLPNHPLAISTGTYTPSVPATSAAFFFKAYFLHRQHSWASSSSGDRWPYFPSACGPEARAYFGNCPAHPHYNISRLGSLQNSPKSESYSNVFDKHQTHNSRPFTIMWLLWRSADDHRPFKVSKMG